jgi:hypothetical protein
VGAVALDTSLTRTASGALTGVKKVNDDITTYSAKTTPVAADQIYIADSAASNAVKRATLGSVTYLPAFIKPPASPNAFNFEARTATTADLATLGFTFRRLTATAGTMVRQGNIDKYRTRGTTTSALGALEYRSSLIDGRLYIQVPSINSIDYVLYKSVSVPTTTTAYGAICWGKVGSAANFNGSGFTFDNEVGFFKDSGGFADNTTLVGTGHYYTNHTMRRFITQGTATDNDMGIPSSIMEDVKITTIRATATNYTSVGEFASSYTGDVVFYSGGTGTGVASNLVYAGMHLGPGSAMTSIADSVPWHYCIDFLRLYTGDLTNVYVADL